MNGKMTRFETSGCQLFSGVLIRDISFSRILVIFREKKIWIYISKDRNDKIQRDVMMTGRSFFFSEIWEKNCESGSTDQHTFVFNQEDTTGSTHMYNKDDDSSRVCASACIQEVRPAFTTIQCGREKVVGPSAFIHTNRIESQISFIVDRNRKTARRRSFNEMYCIVTIASARARERQLGTVRAVHSRGWSAELQPPKSLWQLVRTSYLLNVRTNDKSYLEESWVFQYRIFQVETSASIHGGSVHCAE